MFANKLKERIYHEGIEVVIEVFPTAVRSFVWHSYPFMQTGIQFIFSCSQPLNAVTLYLRNYYSIETAVESDRAFIWCRGYLFCSTLFCNMAN